MAAEIAQEAHTLEKWVKTREEKNMSHIAELFKRMPIEAIVQEQIYDAQRKLLEHEAAAEHHAALAEMYRRRMQRLLQTGMRLESAEPVEDTIAIDLKTGRRLRA